VLGSNGTKNRYKDPDSAFTASQAELISHSQAKLEAKDWWNRGPPSRRYAHMPLARLLQLLLAAGMAATAQRHDLSGLERIEETRRVLREFNNE
jgi:hypothetical protein